MSVFFKRTYVQGTEEQTNKNINKVNIYRGIIGKEKSLPTFTLNYKFSQRIQKVSNPAAIIGDEGKSVTVVYNILDAAEKPEITNLEVTFD